MRTEQVIFIAILAFFVSIKVTFAQQTLELITVMEGESYEDCFGSGISSGDFNNDGYSDVIVGAGGWDNYAGKNIIYFGTPDMDNVGDVVFYGKNGNDFFDYSVSNAGDVNGDGIPDILIPASGHDPGGKIDIFFGASEIDTVSDVEILGESESRLGYDASNAGDVNGDGYDDVIVSAEIGGSSTPNQTFIFWGGAEMDNISDWRLFNAGSIYTEVSSVGDVNGDGFDDVLIKADKFPTSIYFGGVEMDTVADFRFSKPGTGLGAAGVGDLNGDGFSDFAAVRLEGAWPYTLYIDIYFGRTVLDTIPDLVIDVPEGSGVTDLASAGDINGDGYGDLIVGRNFGYYGGASIYLGGKEMNTREDVFMTEWYFGDKVLSAGDVNGDGLDDVIVASPGDPNVNFIGRVYVLSGDSTLVDFNTSVEDENEDNMPTSFKLYQNYPNPFNQTTVINYQLSMHNSQLIVTLKIFNVLGEEVRTLVDRRQGAGSYEVVWDGKDGDGREVASGVYFYRLKTGGFSQIRRLVFLK